MTQLTLQVSEAIYQLFLRQAARLQISPEQLLEYVVQGNVVLFPLDEEPHADSLIMPSESERALQAVERLTTRFAHVTIPNLDRHLDDPLLALANADIERPVYD